MTHDKDAAGEARQDLVASVAGKAKEVAGAVLNNDSLAREGQLQQSEAHARRARALHRLPVVCPPVVRQLRLVCTFSMLKTTLPE